MAKQKPCAGGCGVQVDVESLDNCSDCQRRVVACSECVLTGAWLTCRRCFDLAADDRLWAVTIIGVESATGAVAVGGWG